MGGGELRHWQTRVSESIRNLEMGLRRSDGLAEGQPHGGRDRKAQHGAETGVLGEAEKRSESPGDNIASRTTAAKSHGQRWIAITTNRMNEMRTIST